MRWDNLRTFFGRYSRALCRGPDNRLPLPIVHIGETLIRNTLGRVGIKFGSPREVSPTRENVRASAVPVKVAVFSETADHHSETCMRMVASNFVYTH